jgi:hypothetical protein
MSLYTTLLAWIRPVAPNDDQKKADRMNFDNQSTKTSALDAPPGIQGQKFWDP